MKIKRYAMLLLVMLLVLTGLPVSAHAAESRTVVGFELINADEIPPLVENPHSTTFISNQYCLHNAMSSAEFRVTYSDGTSEIAYVDQPIGDDVISCEYELDGPNGSEDVLIFSLGEFEIEHKLTYAETNVASLEILSEPVLVLGEHPAATKLGDDKGLVLGETYGCIYDGLSFRIYYTDGTSEVIDHADLNWPGHTVYDKFCSFPKHEGYNVEVQAYLTGYSSDNFSYWSGTYFQDGGTNRFPMIMHYKGCVVNFNLTVVEGSRAAVVYQPYDIEAEIGESVAFEIGATGPNLTYQWQYRANATDAWKNFKHGEEPTHTLPFVADAKLDGTQYRCIVTDENGVVVYSEPATLTIFYPAKNLNIDSDGNHQYLLEELVVGTDGVYRTPDGYAAYLAINNVGDGGLWILSENTLYNYVEFYGEDYFSLTYWDELLSLMDEDGYVLLTKQTLSYFRDLTSNPAWGEEDGTWVYHYLAFDYDRGVEVHPDGWAQENDAWYYYQDGEPVTGWLKDGNYWYYMDSTGAMTTGWVSVGGKWYYMNKSGVMQTGWQKINGYWYYMSSGGVMQTGWVSVGGKWYYMNTNGVMQTGWVSVGGKWYYMSSGGIMQTGWITVNGYKYHLDSKGVMQTGWQQIGGSWYYFSKGGVMQTGWVSDGSYWYYMNSDGVMKTGWVSAGGKWYYMNKSGVMQTGWVQDGGYWYYMDSKGVMVTGTQVINGKTYIFNDHGVWIG